MINILFITNQSELTSSTMQSLIILIENLPRRKVRPFVILPENCNIEKQLNHLHVKYFILPLHSSSFSNYFVRKNNIKELVDIIETYYIDIIQSDNLLATHISIAAKQKINFKLIWHINTISESKSEDKLIKKIDAVICTSKSIKQRFDISHYPKFSIIYNSVNCGFYKPVHDIYALKIEVGFHKDNFIIIFVGKLEKEEGIFDLFEAARDLDEKGKEFTLYFIGEGNESDINILENKIKSSNLQERIKILGKQPDVYKYLQISDIFVVPSHSGSRNKSHIISQAFACGTTVVGTNTSEISDIISNAGGIVVPEQSPVRIASAISKWIDNPDMMYRNKEKNRRNAIELFDINKHTLKTLDVYYELLDN